jgi:hypothetical protein
LRAAETAAKTIMKNHRIIDAFTHITSQYIIKALCAGALLLSFPP